MNDQLVVLPEKLQGWYKIEKFLGPQEDGILLETYEFPNLIVNSGLDFMCTTNGPWGATSAGGFTDVLLEPTIQLLLQGRHFF